MGGVGGNLRIRLWFEDLLNNASILAYLCNFFLHFFIICLLLYFTSYTEIFCLHFLFENVPFWANFGGNFRFLKQCIRCGVGKISPKKYTPMQAEYKHKSLRLPVPDVKTVNIAPNSMSPGWLHDSPWLQCPLSTSVDDIMISEWTY